MKKVKNSKYLASKKPVAKELLKQLCEKYTYASILIADNVEKNYSVENGGISVSGDHVFGAKGMVVKVYDGKGYAEYSTNEITFEAIPHIMQQIEQTLLPMADKLPNGLTEAEYRALNDDPLVLNKSTEYEIHPAEMGDEQILAKMKDIREKSMAIDSRLMDAWVTFGYQEYHKLFLSPNRDLEQSILLAVASLTISAVKGEEVQMSYRGYSNLGGAEVLDHMEKDIPELADTAIALLQAEAITPGTYDCICTPDVTGMIAHEAFGHGVEMDMFAKDRALAKDFIGTRVASDLVTMHDGCAMNEVATYFFDDEGTLSHDTVILKDGILQAGISDAQSAMHLGTEPTGNARRESYERKSYARMTNTYFVPGKDKVEDMIKSIKYGMLLDESSSGMEDPKNWGIQLMVNFAREIKDGKLTGRIFCPVVMTGYVPDVLKSISMVSDSMELGGSGCCGKGYKEWIRVSSGGPYIKAKIHLG